MEWSAWLARGGGRKLYKVVSLERAMSRHVKVIITALFTIILSAGADAQNCRRNITLGFGDTTKPSDTRFASQFCSGRRSTAESLMTRAFVPGFGDRIFNNSLTPCEPLRQARLFCGTELISTASIRPGCPNGRATFDFCGPRGGGVRAIDAACRGRKMTVEVTTARGGSFCYNPPGANITFRNGRRQPNRVR
jgi:hypothetical protein